MVVGYLSKQFPVDAAASYVQIRYNDKAAFEQDPNAIDRESLLEPFLRTPSNMVAVFQECFDGVLGLHAPIPKRKGKSECASWLNARIKALMMRRDEAKKDAR